MIYNSQLTLIFSDLLRLLLFHYLGVLPKHGIVRKYHGVFWSSVISSIIQVSFSPSILFLSRSSFLYQWSNYVFSSHLFFFKFFEGHIQTACVCYSVSIEERCNCRNSQLSLGYIVVSVVILYFELCFFLKIHLLYLTEGYTLAEA